MKLRVLLAAFALAACLGGLGGQQPDPLPIAPSVLSKPGSSWATPIVITPGPSAPAAGPNDAKLLGAWTVVFSDNDAFKKCRLAFTKQTLTISDGMSSISVPFRFQQSQEFGRRVVFRVLGTEWAGRFATLGDEVIAFRFDEPPAGGPDAGRPYSLVLMERERSTPPPPVADHK